MALNRIFDKGLERETENGWNRRFSCTRFEIYLNSINQLCAWMDTKESKNTKKPFFPSFPYYCLLLQIMGYHDLLCFNQTFQVSEKYAFVKEIGQGAYGVVW